MALRFEWLPRFARLVPRGPWACAAALALLGQGCRGCHEGHPYVPYSVGTSEPGEASARFATAGTSAVADAALAADAAAPFAGLEGALAPPGLVQWTIDGVTLRAPDGCAFVEARTGDFDGDGHADAFALVGPLRDGGDAVADRVVFYRGAGAAEPIDPAAAFPSPIHAPTDAGCTPIARLVTAGSAAVFAEIGAHCASAPSRGPDRWVAVVSAAGAPQVRLAATIADPSGAAALVVDADASDRDGDGRSDIALRVTLLPADGTPAPARPLAATLAWVDRSAGLSGDVAATESSFAALSSWAAARAARAKDAAEVPAYVAGIRALWRAVCADGGSPRVVAVTGTGTVACGSGRALEEAGLAEVHAYAALGDAVRAALAFDRAERPPATHTASRVTEAQKWIASVATPASVRLFRAVAAVPVALSVREPSWGPLAFEPNGKLLVKTRAGVVRVDADLGDEVDAGVAPWKAAVTSPDGVAQWIEAYDPCDGLPLRATFTLGGGRDERDLELPIAPPLAGRCAGARGAPARTTPIAWGPSGLEAIVAGELVAVASDLAHGAPLAGLLGQPYTPGSPRSPDGKTYVLATGAGLLVRSAEHTRLLRASELDGTYGDQQACAVSNDSTHVGCVHAGAAWVGTWDAP
jgi:hypothetical protein